MILLNKIGVEIEGFENSDFLNETVHKALDDNYGKIGKDYYPNQFEIKTGAISADKFKYNFINEMKEILNNYKKYILQSGSESRFEFKSKTSDIFNGLHIHTSYSDNSVFENETFINLATILGFSYAIALTNTPERVVYSHHIWGRFIYAPDNFRGSNPKYEPVYISEERENDELSQNNNLHVKKDKTIEFRIFDSVLPDMFLIESLYEFLIKVQILSNVKRGKFNLSKENTLLMTHGLFSAINEYIENVNDYDTKRMLYFYMLKKYISEYICDKEEFVNLFIPIRILTKNKISHINGLDLVDTVLKSYSENNYLQDYEIIDFNNGIDYDSIIKKSKKINEFTFIYNFFAIFYNNEKIRILKQILFSSFSNKNFFRSKSLIQISNGHVRNFNGLNSNYIYPMLGYYSNDKENVIYHKNNDVSYYCHENSFIKFPNISNLVPLRGEVFVTGDYFIKIVTYFLYKTFLLNKENDYYINYNIKNKDFYYLCTYIPALLKNNFYENISNCEIKNIQERNIKNSLYNFMSNISNLANSFEKINHEYKLINKSNENFIEINNVAFTIEKFFLTFIILSNNNSGEILKAHNIKLRSSSVEYFKGFTFIIKEINEKEIVFYSKLGDLMKKITDQKIKNEYIKIKISLNSIINDTFINYGGPKSFLEMFKTFNIIYQLNEYKNYINKKDAVLKSTIQKIDLLKIITEILNKINCDISNQSIERKYNFISKFKIGYFENFLMNIKTGIKLIDEKITPVIGVNNLAQQLYLDKILNDSNLIIEDRMLFELVSNSYINSFKFLSLTQRLFILNNMTNKHKNKLHKIICEEFAKNDSSSSERGIFVDKINSILFKKFKVCR